MSVFALPSERTDFAADVFHRPHTPTDSEKSAQRMRQSARAPRLPKQAKSGGQAPRSAGELTALRPPLNPRVAGDDTGRRDAVAGVPGFPPRDAG